MQAALQKLIVKKNFKYSLPHYSFTVIPQEGILNA
jgi:hypothetical protein